MVVPKRDTFRLFSESQAVNSQVEQTPKVMPDLLRGLDCNMWEDDVFYFAEDEISLLCLLDEILGRLESVVCSSLLTSALFSLANWFGLEKCILMVSCRMIPPVSKV